MKRLLLISLVLAGMLLSSCGTATTTQSSVITTSSTPTTTLVTPTTSTTTSSAATTTTTSTPAVTTSTSTVTTTGTSTVFPTAVYVPNVAQYKPAGAELELFQYVLSLVNTDRQTAGLPPVTLAYNAAAQTHAQDMFKNFYGSHWGTDGLKPYMRYTNAGGLNKEGENSAYSGWFNPADDPNNYAPLNVRDEIASIEHIMMYDDAASNWGHRDTIMNKQYTRVSIGIAYDNKRLALVQQFDEESVDYYTAPTVSNGNLNLLGKLKLAGVKINNISISYDPPLQALTNAQLTTDPAYTDGYSLGGRLISVIPPAPAGQQYVNLPSTAIIASKWEVNDSGQFAIQANINTALSKGKGVYTIVIVATINGESVNLTNYSIVVE